MTDSEVNGCRRCGNLYCPSCGSDLKRLCDNCINDMAEADDKREARALAEWRNSKRENR